MALVVNMNRIRLMKKLRSRPKSPIGVQRDLVVASPRRAKMEREKYNTVHCDTTPNYFNHLTEKLFPFVGFSALSKINFEWLINRK
jgi:hypothetical protein